MVRTTSDVSWCFLDRAFHLRRVRNSLLSCTNMARGAFQCAKRSFIIRLQEGSGPLIRFLLHDCVKHSSLSRWLTCGCPLRTSRPGRSSLFRSEWNPHVDFQAANPFGSSAPARRRNAEDFSNPTEAGSRNLAAGSAADGHHKGRISYVSGWIYTFHIKHRGPLWVWGLKHSSSEDWS